MHQSLEAAGPLTKVTKSGRHNRLETVSGANKLSSQFASCPRVVEQVCIKIACTAPCEGGMKVLPAAKLAV